MSGGPGFFSFPPRSSSCPRPREGRHPSSSPGPSNSRRWGSSRSAPMCRSPASNGAPAPTTSPTRASMPLPRSTCPPWAQQLQALGFVPLGAHVQKSRFQRGTRSHDFAHPGEHAFATLYLSALGAPRLYLLTPLAGGGAVLTEGAPSSARVLFGFVRAGEASPVPPEVLLGTHRERLRGLVPGADFTPHGRLLAGRAWFQGPGQREIRRQSLPGLLWTLVALAMVAFLFVGGRTV